MKLANPTLFRQQCFINGEWVAAVNNETFTVTNPFDNSFIGTIPNCGKKETAAAINAANLAWHGWRNLTAKERAALLWRLADLMKKNKDDLSLIMTYEQGKPLSESKGEIDYAISFIEWFAEEGRRIYGDVILANNPHQRLLVIKQSVGVVAAISPWNFPSAMITRKCAPALAAGCPIVIKPSEETPYSALALAVLAEEAGIPKGVFNVITGNAKEIGAELTTNELVRKLSFTGSTKVGKLLMAQSASSVKKLSLELGGNAPFIVFEDANLDAAIVGVMASKFRNTGQTCVCANRILVHAAIYDIFLKKLLIAVRKLQTGNGLDPQVQQGPLINEAAMTKVQKHIADAQAKGAKVVYGGKPHELGGLFFQTTVISEATTDMLLAQEETFGPVAALFLFENEEEAITIANTTPYGLAAYFYTENLARTWRVAERLEYGIIGINEGIISTEVAPFGGMKDSGLGREGSKYGIEDYLEIKYLCMGNL